jgi:hypothetical protein
MLYRRLRAPNASCGAGAHVAGRWESSGMPYELKIECAELLAMAEENPREIEIIVEMLIEADEELCENLLGA